VADDVAGVRLIALMPLAAGCANSPTSGGSLADGRSVTIELNHDLAGACVRVGAAKISFDAPDQEVDAIVSHLVPISRG
jgi:hypothetical protein